MTSTSCLRIPTARRRRDSASALYSALSNEVRVPPFPSYHPCDSVHFRPYHLRHPCAALLSVPVASADQVKQTTRPRAARSGPASRTSTLSRRRSPSLSSRGRRTLRRRSSQRTATASAGGSTSSLRAQSSTGALSSGGASNSRAWVTVADMRGS